jgi:hypothetical protein
VDDGDHIDPFRLSRRAPAGLELMAGEPQGLEVLANSAYGSAATRTELKTMGHHLVIRPLASHPAVPGGSAVTSST